LPRGFGIISSNSADFTQISTRGEKKIDRNTINSIIKFISVLLLYVVIIVVVGGGDDSFPLPSGGALTAWRAPDRLILRGARRLLGGQLIILLEG
jgi:hypothetical protein